MIVLDYEFCVRLSVFFPSLLSFPIKMHATDVKMQKIKPDPFLFMTDKSFVGRDWQNRRSYLFFNVSKSQTQCAKSLRGNDLALYENRLCL